MWSIGSFALYPLGWQTARPEFFTKILAELVLYLHLQEIVLIPYLDDLLVYNQSRNLLLSDLVKVVSTF